QLVRLARSFWCYLGDEDEEVTVEPPCVAAGSVTFGSLNSPAKISAPVIETWAKILTAVPTSRLMLFASERVNAGERPRNEFASRGIASDRLAFVPRLSRSDYLKQYAQIDIALDPWPYNGDTTTCDAIWMGLPVVSLIGQTSVARAGWS